MTNSIIIMAAGASSRMKKSAAPSELNRKHLKNSNLKSKVLLEFGSNSRPFLSYLIENIIESGFQNIYIVTSQNAIFFRENFKKVLKIDFKNCKINFSIQYVPKKMKKPIGTADAILQTIEQFPNLKSESFCVCNGDNIYSIESLKKIKSVDANFAFVAYDRNGLNFPKERILAFSVIKLDSKNNLLDIIEKPKNLMDSHIDIKGKIRVNMNLLKFSSKISYDHFKNCPINKERNEKEITDVLKMLILSKEKVVGIPVFDKVYDLTSKKDIIKIEKILK